MPAAPVDPARELNLRTRKPAKAAIARPSENAGILPQLLPPAKHDVFEFGPGEPLNANPNQQRSQYRAVCFQIPC